MTLFLSRVTAITNGIKIFQISWYSMANVIFDWLLSAYRIAIWRKSLAMNLFIFIQFDSKPSYCGKNLKRKKNPTTMSVNPFTSEERVNQCQKSIEKHSNSETILFIYDWIVCIYHHWFRHSRPEFNTKCEMCQLH